MIPVIIVSGTAMPARGYVAVTMTFKSNGRVLKTTIAAESEPDKILRLHEDTQLFKTMYLAPGLGE